MTTLRTAAQQALEALEKVGLRADTRRGCDEAVGILRAALAQQDEPVAWLQPKTVNAYSRPDLGYESCSSADYGAFPVYRALPRCPNCASLEAQNDELDRKLAEMERAEPQRRLTDDQIGRIWFEVGVPGLPESGARRLIRAAEAEWLK